MIELPKQLQDPRFEFCKVDKNISERNPDGKKPIGLEWQKNPYRYNQLNGWNGNVGVLCGRGGLVVIDCDKLETQKAVKEGLPETFVMQTCSGGTHWYYLCDDMKNIQFLSEGCGEIRANGQVLCYGEARSKKENIPKPYRILIDKPIAEVSKEQIHEALKDLMNINNAEKRDAQKKLANDIILNKTENRIRHEIPETIQTLIENGAKSGERNKKRWLIVNDLWWCGYSDEEILEAVEKFNRKCDPPEQTSIVINHVNSLLNNIKYLNKPLLFGFERIMYREKLRNEMNKGYGKEKIPFDTKGFYKEVADVFLKNYEFRCCKDDDELFLYDTNKGIYENSAEPIINETITKELDKLGVSNVKKEVIDRIKHSNYVDRRDFNGEVDKVVLKNCILDLKTLEALPFDKKYLFTYSLPVEYDPNAKCEKWLDFLKNKCETEEDINTLQDYFGFCLLNDMRFETALMLVGPKRSGKSTTLFVLNNMIGWENCSNLSLHTLNENRFALAQLFNKKANIFADLPIEALKSISNFMVITGRDYVETDRKNKSFIRFVSMAKPVFSCNQIPRIPVKEDAFYRRWIILKFPNSVPADKVDENFKIDMLKELSGILNWSIEGARNLLTDHRIRYRFNEGEVKTIWNKSSDSVCSFIENCIEIDDFEKEIIRNLYKEYGVFCKNNGLRPEPMRRFCWQFKEETGCGTCRSSKECLPSYSGVKLKIRSKVEGVNAYIPT